MKNLITSVLAITLLLFSCGKSEKPALEVAVEPTDVLQQKLSGSDYSIVLNDMNVEEQNDLMVFKHKYHIFKVENDSLIVDSLDWKPVNEKFFTAHENDLGMEIVSNHNGKLSRVAQPVGYGWAIGNPKYGEWVSKDEEKDSIVSDSTTVASKNHTTSERRWRSHTPSLLFWYWMLRRPAYQRDYNSYNAYRATSTPYYGRTTTGAYTHGTRSTYQQSKRPSFYSRVKSNSGWKSFSSRKSRSSSRYSGSSSTRSRSGGFGK
ncbi:hypothetical protein [Pseudofulvibacter geojedonensis]|uniref:Lipoprotein n=1 Tax=Pseudofulvibacter geojedonensis TaxID=1123758 RepID=A0ABW3I3W3_9FLAO